MIEQEWNMSRRSSNDTTMMTTMRPISMNHTRTTHNTLSTHSPLPSPPPPPEVMALLQTRTTTTTIIQSWCRRGSLFQESINNQQQLQGKEKSE
jgi:hypothetical protein